MKETQKKLLEQYLVLSERPTLREISEETGIQITRIFRLLNGSAMKLSEYEVFNRLVQKKMGLENSLVLLAGDCMKKLAPESLQEIEGLLRRKLAIWELKQKSNMLLAEQTFA